ncbi:SAM-dependent methyltransferase [Micromonospora sp. IBHARD004]|uniref:SAM-dependent methyltransferase n=1 Tax=Micromonospora sp. IBHARD004 TaxID=3457764 RepID=UPI0040594574
MTVSLLPPGPVAQDVAPKSPIVYVDNDPTVLVHARALLGSTTSEGVTAPSRGGLLATPEGGCHASTPSREQQLACADATHPRTWR